MPPPRSRLGLFRPRPPRLGLFRPRPPRLAPVDEANLVLDHPGQVNVFLAAALLVPGGFVSADGTPDMSALRAVLGERIAAIPQLRRVPVPGRRQRRWHPSPGRWGRPCRPRQGGHRDGGTGGLR